MNLNITAQTRLYKIKANAIVDSAQQHVTIFVPSWRTSHSSPKVINNTTFLCWNSHQSLQKQKKRTCVSRVCNPKHKKGFETYFQCIGEATSTVETESLAVNLQVSGCANGEESGLQQTFRRHNTKCRVLGLVFLLNVNRHAHNEDRNHIQEWIHHRHTSVLSRGVKRWLHNNSR